MIIREELKLKALDNRLTNTPEATMLLIQKTPKQISSHGMAI
jgi:hypothetical protein